MDIPLLSTILFIPEPRNNLVLRKRLIKQLEKLV